MRSMRELQEKIESVRLELGEAFAGQEQFEYYYSKSKELDQLIEEYLEKIEKSAN